MIGGRGKLHMCRTTLFGCYISKFPEQFKPNRAELRFRGDARSRLGEEAAQSRLDLGENAPARSRSRSRPSIKIAFGLGSGVPNRARSVHSQACSQMPQLLKMDVNDGFSKLTSRHLHEFVRQYVQKITTGMVFFIPFSLNVHHPIHNPCTKFLD